MSCPVGGMRRSAGHRASCASTEVTIPATLGAYLKEPGEASLEDVGLLPGKVWRHSRNEPGSL